MPGALPSTLTCFLTPQQADLTFPELGQVVLVARTSAVGVSDT